LPPSEVLVLTLAAGLAVHTAVKQTGLTANLDLKWPNDVLISGRKCAGILLETTTEGDLPAAIVGIGINIRKGSVPEWLESSAVCLDQMADALVPRRQVLVQFLRRFQECYQIFEKGDFPQLLDRWKGHSSMWNGAEVWITEGGMRRSAVTCGLSDTGGLQVMTPEGMIETILAADVSIKRAAKAPINVDVGFTVE
jgi:BirA family biotin operon repressor/biotin-[acetyl-CoA-carboxylase] ligase